MTECKKIHSVLRSYLVLIKAYSDDPLSLGKTGQDCHRFYRLGHCCGDTFILHQETSRISVQSCDTQRDPEERRSQPQINASVLLLLCGSVCQCTCSNVRSVLSDKDSTVISWLLHDNSWMLKTACNKRQTQLK